MVWCPEESALWEEPQQVVIIKGVKGGKGLE